MRAFKRNLQTKNIQIFLIYTLTVSKYVKLMREVWGRLKLKSIFGNFNNRNVPNLVGTFEI